ncbi:MAG: hypothetical protein R2710_27385 [Acidimicrobiales bacterium]
MSEEGGGRARANGRGGGRARANEHGGGRARADEHGTIALPAVISIAILLLAFVLATQFAVWLYAKGALRSAVQSAARAAAPLDAPVEACGRAFELARSSLLDGDVGAGVGGVRCDRGPTLVTVEVDAHFDAWLPITPGWHTTVRAVAVREVEPA